MGRSVALGEGLGALKFHAHGACVAAVSTQKVVHE